MNKHGVTKAEEAVAFFDGVLVGSQGLFTASEGGDQHDQG